MNRIKNLDELPYALTVEEMAKVLGIGRAKAYELVHEKDFPKIYIGRRIIILKTALRTFLNSKMEESKD